VAEVQEKQNQLNQLIDKQQQDYLDQMKDLEPKFAEALALLVKSLTGVVAEDKHDIICYLIHKAILNADSSKYYIIRTSKEDYESAMSKKVELETMVKEGTSIEIVLDKDLEKNQCLIETDTIIIDCSLDVQLNNLIQDIKLLSI
jgi:flagellar assembly protein FliH